MLLGLVCTHPVVPAQDGALVSQGPLLAQELTCGWCPLRTHRHVLVVLAQLVGGCHHLALLDPLLQVIQLTAQLAQPQVLLQALPPLSGQLLQASVQLVHLGLADGYPCAVGEGERPST